MTTILLSIRTSDNIANDSLNISINNIPVEYSVSSNIIKIFADLTFGFHMLSVCVADHAMENIKQLQFTDVTIDEISLSHYIYLSFTVKNNQRINTTALTTNFCNEWNLPFGNPISWWEAECQPKISNGLYGKNLADTLEIFYPESIIIDNCYPKKVQDFFKYNLGFHSYNKKLNNVPMNRPEIPFIKMNLEYDEEALYAEFVNNLELLETQQYTNEVWQTGDPELPEFRIAMAITPSINSTDLPNNRFIYNNDDFPVLLNFIKSIKGIDLRMLFITSLRPGSYAFAHIDDGYNIYAGFPDGAGCCQIFIPIGWKTGNYFKYNNIGLIPYDQGALLTSPTTYTHSSINQSNSIRFTIAIVCKFVDNDFLEYFS